MRFAMRQPFRKLLALGIIAAFLLMATAMVLPHTHDAETAHHACWVCQAKAIGVSAPSVGPDPVSLHFTAFSTPAAPALFCPQAIPLCFEARAPPFASPVLP